jgi:DNA-binding transcriptional LysR family regulator
MFQHALLNEIIAFVAVADNGSFTKAAQKLHTTKSSVGKAIQKLEDDLRLKLFHRSTRSVKLTEEGHIYLSACKTALEAISEAKHQLDARQAEPAGTLRINTPIGIGHTIMQSLSKFTSAYPKVIPEVSMSDNFVEAINENLDLVIRIGELADSAMVARKLCDLKTILCASPNYLSAFGYPDTLNSLEQHKAILFRAPNGRLRQWYFHVDKKKEKREFVPKQAAIFSDGRAMVDAAVNGIGIAQIYDKSAIQALHTGALIELLPEYASIAQPMHALIPAGRIMPPKTKVFVEFLQTIFEQKS